MTPRTKKWQDIIYKGALKLNIHLEAFQLEQFSVFAEQLLLWNRKKNLTAITDPEEIAIKHMLDAMAPLGHIKEAARVLDIGSGGGFPGIPLKIAAPHLTLTLIDAAQKKVNFLKHVIRSLKLETIHAEHVRGENFMVSPQNQRAYDVVISRAFSDLTRFASMALPVLAPGGVLMAMKGKMFEDEMNALIEDNRVQALVGPLEIETIRYQVPFLEAERALCCIRVNDA